MAQIVHLTGLEMWMGLEMRRVSGMKQVSLAHSCYRLRQLSAAYHYGDMRSTSKTTTKTAISKLPVPVQLVERRIYMIRGQKVTLDADLAELYQVPTKRVNEQVQRNPGRFPKDFMFRLKEAEAENLRSQIATSSWGGRRNLPYAFTEHGVAMLSALPRDGSQNGVRRPVTCM